MTPTWSASWRSSGLIAAAYGIQATLRLRTEETAGRAEPVLATAVGRLQWAGSHLVFAILGPAAVLLHLRSVRRAHLRRQHR